MLQRKSLTLQRRASDIVRFLQVDEQNGNSELVAALRNFQNKNGVIEKNAPQVRCFKPPIADCPKMNFFNSRKQNVNC